jgi:septal ring factor EnvC (AmiA/AmiB activator)
MRVFAVMMAVSLVFVISGCSHDTKIENFRAEIERLKKELNECQSAKQNLLNQTQHTMAELEAQKGKNIRMQTDAAASEIRLTGALMTAVLIALGIFLLNNLIWLIIYRRKNDRFS